MNTHTASVETPVRKIHRTRSIPFFFLHFVALAAVIVAPFAWKWVGLCVGMYYLRMFAITGGYHRYFSHRTYKTSRAFQFFMACLAQSSAQKGAMWWAANHRHHHKFSDQVEDIHSPLHTGFFWSHVGWILCEDNDRTHWELIPDFKKYPELVWLDRYPHVPALALALILFAAGGFPALAWGFFMSTVLLWHGTFTINSLSHVYGTRRYTTTDTSRNNFWLALLTLGEGWHNNHHCYQSSTNQGFFWWEIDITYYILKGLSKVGVVWDLRKPPLELLEAKRIGRDVRDAMPLTPADTVKPKAKTLESEEVAARVRVPAQSHA
jgi:stearoyl-CoA desaturase (delta-9 desaturase)